MQGVSRRVDILFDMIKAYFACKDTPFQRSAQLFSCFFAFSPSNTVFPTEGRRNIKGGVGKHFLTDGLHFSLLPLLNHGHLPAKSPILLGSCVSFCLFLLLLILYLPSTYPLLNFYLSSIFILPFLHPISTKIAGIFRHDAFIPNLGILRSQFGSVLFPTWESHIPKLGMHAIRGLTIFS